MGTDPLRKPASEARVFGCLPVIGQRGCTEAGVRKALTKGRLLGGS
jgi:hypothetical protein